MKDIIGASDLSKRVELQYKDEIGDLGHTFNLMTGQLEKAYNQIKKQPPDLITLDLRGHDDASTGDRVVLWGEGLAVETVSEWADAVPYELICGVTGRVPRIAV